MDSEAEKWKKRYEREKSARGQAELLLEQKSKELYEANKKLEEQVLIEASKFKLEEEKYRAVHQASLDGIILHTTEGIIIDVNDKMCHLIDREKEHLVGHYIEEFLAEESLGFIQGAMEELNRLDYVRRECFFKRLDEADVPAEVSVSQFEVEGSVIVQAVVRDLTESIQSAKKLEEATNEAIEANEAKSLFLATMSHEIRTPLNGIIGFTEILLEESIADEHRQHLELIQKSGDMLLHIITDILDFSRVENHYIELDESEFSIIDCIEETLDVQSKAASSKDVDLLYKVEDGFPEYLFGDSGRLRQILLNLVSNGLKFTSQGSVVVSAKQIDSDTLEISVTDTGVGFEMDIAEKLFEPFQQADASTTRNFGGTGLGLAICRRLITAMAGTISAYSEPGKGACFKITFPLRRANAQVSSIREDYDLSSIAGSHALVVDDHPINLKFMQARLSQWGIKVTVASSAQEALRLLSKDEKFQIILTDYQMPEMDGVELAKGIIKILKDKAPPIVLVTSSRLSNEKKEAVSEGVADVIYKPVREKVLLSSVYKAFNKVEIQPASLTSVDKPPLYPARKKSGDYSHILVVEDNPINAQLAKILIENLGAIVAVSANGQEAIKELERNDIYDLVMMDMQMPVMDGLEATKRIRKGEGGINYKTIPIIAMTANAQSKVKEECLESGMNDYITKPIDKVKLKKVLELFRCVS